MIEPLRMAFDVRCPAAHAFDLWTQRSTSSRPAAHTVSAEPGVQVIFEGRAAGRIFERMPACRELEWGEITVWEPPRGHDAGGDRASGLGAPRDPRARLA